MISIVILTIIVIYALLFPTNIQAIVVIPAIVLIPIAQMVAAIISGLSVPIVSFGILIKIFTNNRKLAVKLTILLFVLTVLLSIIIMKWKYPDNPLF